MTDIRTTGKHHLPRADRANLASPVQMSVFCAKLNSSPLNILKSYYYVIKLCSDVRSLNVLI